MRELKTRENTIELKSGGREKITLKEAVSQPAQKIAISAENQTADAAKSKDGDDYRETTAETAAADQVEAAVATVIAGGGAAVYKTVHGRRSDPARRPENRSPEANKDERQTQIRELRRQDARADARRDALR